MSLIDFNKCAGKTTEAQSRSVTINKEGGNMYRQKGIGQDAAQGAKVREEEPRDSTGGPRKGQHQKIHPKADHTWGRNDSIFFSHVTFLVPIDVCS